MKFNSFFSILLLFIGFNLFSMDGEKDIRHSPKSPKALIGCARKNSDPYVRGTTTTEEKKLPDTYTCRVCNTTFDSGLLLTHDQDICKATQQQTVKNFLSQLALNERAGLALSRPRNAGMVSQKTSLSRAVSWVDLHDLSRSRDDHDAMLED